MPRNVSEIADLVRAGMTALDASGFASLFAADAVYEKPFLGQRTEGRSAITAELTAHAAHEAARSAWRRPRSR